MNAHAQLWSKLQAEAKFRSGMRSDYGLSNEQIEQLSNLACRTPRQIWSCIQLEGAQFGVNLGMSEEHFELFKSKVELLYKAELLTDLRKNRGQSGAPTRAPSSKQIPESEVTVTFNRAFLKGLEEYAAEVEHDRL